MKHERSASGRSSIAAAIFVAATALAGSAKASDCTSNGAGAGGTCPAVSLTNLYVESGVTGTGGNVYISVNGAMTPLGCTLASGYITLPKAASNFNATYASLLTAQTTKATFDLRVLADSGGNCVVAYLLMH